MERSQFDVKLVLLTFSIFFQSWIRHSAHGTAKQLSLSNMERVLKREELLLVHFLPPSTPDSSPLAARLRVSLAELETVFGLAVVTVSDPAVASALGNLPKSDSRMILKKNCV